MIEQPRPLGAVFLSYASEDADAAAHVCEALRAAGVEVWFDKNELRSGDAWDSKIKRQIQECALFMPVISARTNARTEGYFRREWKLATHRLLDIADDAAFLVPVVIDDTSEAHARVPEEFRRVQWTRLPEGKGSAEFARQVLHLLSHDPSAVSPASPAAAKMGRPGGLRRRKWIRPLVAVASVAAIAGIAVWVWATRGHVTSEFTRPSRPDELPIVAVLPLENLTGRKELDWAGEGVSNLVRDGLAQSRYLAVVSAARTIRLTKDAKGTDDVFSRAVDSGITHVLTGEVLRTPQGLTVTSRLTDLLRNVEVGANRREALDPDELVGVATPVTSVIKQALGVPGTEKVDVFGADYATRNIAAYEAFVVGMQHFLAFDYASAKQLFETAVQKAPDFAMARYRLAHADAVLGDTDAALEQVRLAKQESARLSSREQQYIAAGENYFARNNAEAERQYRALLEAYPYEAEARVLLLYVLWSDSRFEEALVQAETLVSQDPGDEVGWSSMAEINLRLARYDEAEQAVQKFLGIAPKNPNAHFLLAESNFLRSHFKQAIPEYQEALALDPTFGDAGLRLAHIEVLENRPDAAIKRLQEMATSETVTPAFRTTAATDAAHLLRAEGRCPDAEALLTRLEPEFAAEKITVAYALSIRARCRLDMGDLPGAMSLAREALGKSPGRPTRYVLIRGLVETAAGDLAAVDRTIAELRGLKPPPAPDDHTDEAAAKYLAGLRALQAGQADIAVPMLKEAVTAGGTRYGVYEVTLAEALAAKGDTRAAIAAARTAAGRGAPGDLNLELEADRRKAGRLLRRLGG